jgi:hypothetical protein
MKRGGYIKFDKDMADDPRTNEAAIQLTKRYSVSEISPQGERALSPGEQFRFQCNAVTGALVTLWKHADVHIRADNTLPMQSAALDSMVGIQGFCEVISPDWVDELDDGTLILPGYCEKNSLNAKRIALVKGNARVAAFRAKKKISGNGSGNAHVTQPSTVTSQISGVTKVVDPDLKSKKDKYKEKDKREEGEKRPPPSGNGDVTALQNGKHESGWGDYPSMETLATAARLPASVLQGNGESERKRRWNMCRADYPEGGGRIDWIGAEHHASKLVSDGLITWEELYAAVMRYKLYVQATGAFIMNPVKFFHADDKPWSMPWTIPEERSRKKPATRIAKTLAQIEAEEAANAKH